MPNIPKQPLSFSKRERLTLLNVAMDKDRVFFLQRAVHVLRVRAVYHQVVVVAVVDVPASPPNRIDVTLNVLLVHFCTLVISDFYNCIRR